MKRREMLISAAAVAAAPLAACAQGSGSKGGDARQYLELRKYLLMPGRKKEQFVQFMANAAVPALNRIGVSPVGAFTVQYGQNTPAAALYVLVPYPSLEAWSTAKYRLAADEQFMADGAEVLNAPLSDPAYIRVETTLMQAFKGMPTVEIPPQKKAGKGRIFELRIYESHSVTAAIKKIEMFNAGGEIQLFRDTGLNPVFFGETMAGQQMPNLVYMLCHDDMAARDASWKVFVESDGWNELKAKEEYKDTVSNISDIILRPTGFSQL
ncbi:MAG: NIPSNAP family containing protein [Candidatus Glassbacteria bacterium]|nr:NIPSNAP family containing protein [Candidatus Glassbacteria bacterium]